MSAVIITLPIKTESESNLREHWGAKHRRSSKQRWNTKIIVQSKLNSLPSDHPLMVAIRKYRPLSITLVRLAPRKLDEGNIQAAFKAVQDGVSDALDIDDGSPLLHWSYEQRKGEPKEYSVVVRLEACHS
jgi:hypothetical protein